MNKFGRDFRRQYPPGTSNPISNGLWGPSYATANEDQRNVRRAANYYGPGDYRSSLRQWIPDGTFAYAGRTLGQMSGIPGLAELGNYAGGKLANWAGFGDYSTNQIMGGSGNQQAISVNRTDNTGDIYISRTEFVKNIVVTGTAGGVSNFENRTFLLNPGITNTFPWLSQIANCFTMYDFQGLIFQYKPLFSEDAGSSNNLGKVIMATDYDPTAPAFLTSVQMENYDYSNSTKPSCGCLHGVETAQSQQSVNMMYVRTGTVSRDLSFYDVGSFQFATEGVPLPAASTSQIIGELWVTYRVKLSRAEIYSSLLGNNILCDLLKGTSSSSALYTGTTLTKSSNNIGVTLANVSSTSMELTFPVNISLGYFQVIVWFQSGGTAFTTQSGATFTNATNCQYYLPGSTLPGTSSTNFFGPGGTYTGTTGNGGLLNIQYIYVNSPGLNQASVRINVGAALTNTTTWTVVVTQQPQNVSLSIT